jgi:hypothetical protein
MDSSEENSRKRSVNEDKEINSKPSGNVVSNDTTNNILSTKKMKLLDQIKELSKDYRIGYKNKPTIPVLHHGWFYEANRDVIEMLVNNETDCIIELGSWLGRSAMFCAEKAPNSIVFAVDLWENSHILGDKHYTHSSVNVAMLDQPMYEQFLINTWEYKDININKDKDFKPHGSIIPVRMDSCAALKLLKENDVEPDMIYVDANHHYDGAYDDIKTCLDLFPNAHIIGDDWDYPDVRKAAQDLAALYKLPLYVKSAKCWSFSKKELDNKDIENEKTKKEKSILDQELKKKKIKLTPKNSSMQSLLDSYKNKK